MALYIARPVCRFQTIVVSRWLVMPIAAISTGSTFSRSHACWHIATVVSHKSSGSCSTQPDCGKCWANSSCAVARGWRFWSKMIARVEVVPWSIAKIYFLPICKPVLSRNRKYSYRLMRVKLKYFTIIGFYSSQRTNKITMRNNCC